MKTAMQELMQWMEKNEFMVNKGFIEKLNECLEKEKEQIMEAFVNGKNKPRHIFQLGEQYYNQTYNQDRELGKEVTDLLENYKKDKTFKQKSKWI